MDPYVFAAVLLAAACHAGWNALIKFGLDPFSTTALISVGSGLVALPILPFVGAPIAAAWPWLFASLALHLFYYVGLTEAYRAWGRELTPDYNPYEAGLGFAVKLDKGDFLGREALLERSEPTRRLVCLVLDDARSVALGSEPVRVHGEIAGRVTSGGYGYTVERSIAYAYVPAAAAAPGRPVEVEIFGEWVGGEVADEPLFDPAGERIRA